MIAPPSSPFPSDVPNQVVVWSPGATNFVLPEVVEAEPKPTPTDNRPEPTKNPDGLPPKPKNARYQSLDIWRGAACLMLVCYHAQFFAEHAFALGDRQTWTLGNLAIFAIRKLWIGVPIFFVVSGYCIAASLDSLRRRPCSLLSYFTRRFRRIYPPLWIACAMATLITLTMNAVPAWYNGCEAHLIHLHKMSLANWIGNFTASEHWLHLFTGQHSNFLMGNTWTLCYEEQFYVVMGLVLLLAARRFFVASMLIAVATVVVRHTCRALDIEIAGLFFDGYWLLFAAGILAYEWLNYLSPTQRRWAGTTLVAGMVYGACERLWQPRYIDWHLGEYIFVSSAFALFLVWMKRWDEPFARHRLMQPLAWCGQRSYSIYLTHYPVVVAMTFGLSLLGWKADWQVAFIATPLSIGVALGLGGLFYRLVERRFLNVPMAT